MPQYATNSIYRVQVKTGKSWRKHDVCRLLISVGQPYHEREKLDATFYWVSQNFEKCLIFVNDVLQRYNYIAAGIPEEEAYARSLKEGNFWLQRNHPMIERLPIYYDVMRWEKWLMHKEFPERLRQIQHLHEHNASFKEAIHADVSRFIITQKKHRFIPYKMESSIRENSVLFILEETAACSLWLEETEAVDVYPGSELKAMKMIRDEPELSPCLLSLTERTFTRIDFDRRKSDLKQAA